MSSDDSSRAAERIQAALDEQVARRRQLRGSAPSAAPILNSGLGSAPRYLGFGLLALALHAAGFVWYQQRNSGATSVESAAGVATLRLDEAKEDGPGTPQSLASDPSSSPAATELLPLRTSVSTPGQHGVIKHDGKVIVVPASPRSSTPRVRSVVAVPVAPAAPASPSRAQAPVSAAEAAPSRADHAAAAQDYAYNHFRYEYKVGSANYAVTSLRVVLSSTKEVPMWNRYLSEGEAGLEYYDGSSFRRTTRRFEVLTELQDGEVRGFEITVK